MATYRVFALVDRFGGWGYLVVYPGTAGWTFSAKAYDTPLLAECAAFNRILQHISKAA